ncbi:MAG: DHH family phosphoesterase, partial [Alphaproteobacteria bacterium]|nr:DHH family phosphoesterase [Alphaproteobacteria bacterium]
DEKKINLLASKIAGADSIAIVGHKNPDPDSFGSVLGLGRLIQLNFGKKPVMIYDGNLPKYMDFLPGRMDAVFAEKLPESIHYDLLFVLDLANPARQFGDFKDKIVGASDFIIKIDHHPFSETFGDLNIDDDSAAATSEIMFDIARGLNWKFDADAANLLLAGIINDTGQFAFVRRGHALRASADLIDLGADMEYLVREMDKLTKKHVMSESQVLCGAEFYGDLAIAGVSRKDYKNLDGVAGNVIDMLRRIDSVEYIVVATDAKDGEVRLSFRSKTKPINHIAEMFDGGGHAYAAGGRFFGSLAEAKAAVVRAITGR